MRAMDNGMPLSRLSSHAISSACCSSRSASRFRYRPRSDAGVLRHGPDSRARRAAETALSTSAASASAICASSSPVAGLTVEKVFPEVLANHSLLMSSRPGVETLSPFWVVDRAVAIITHSLSLDKCLQLNSCGGGRLFPQETPLDFSARGARQFRVEDY